MATKQWRGRGPSGRWRALGVLATGAVLVLSACSGGSTDGSAGPTSSDVEVDAMNPVTEVDMPTKSFQPPSDKHILIMVCGSAGQGCVLEGQEAKKAAESLGWTVDTVDGKLDPTVWNQTIQQAADSDIDGIIAISSDPNLYTDAMRSVADKDIPFVLTNQMPADDDVAGVDTYLAPDPVKGGHDIADWIIADSDEKANVLLLDLPGYADAMSRTKTIGDDLESDCADCTLTRADIAVQTMGTSLAPLVTSELQQHPEIDYVWSPDDCCASFIQQGIQQAGKTSSVKLVSMGGFPDQLARLDTGELTADLATATNYTAWLAVDSLARDMAGQPTEKYWAVPQRLFTTANLDDAPDTLTSVGWETDFDFRSTFKKLWSLQ